LAEVSKINPTNRNLPDSFVYIDLDSVENGILRKENLINLTGAPSRAQRLLEKNDILYQTVRPYQKNNLFFEQ
jgi:type I restriction enzyme S subunit